MQSTGIKHTGPHSLSAKQESSNTSSTLNAMKMGSEEKEKKKAPHSHSLTAPPPYKVGWGENQKGKSEAHYGLR